MKISSDDAMVIARVLERYMIYAQRFMEKGFNAHPESLRNQNLFVETAQDLALITKLYPAFAGGKDIAQAVQERIDNTTLPDPVRIVRAKTAPVPVNPSPLTTDENKFHQPEHFRTLLDQYPGSDNL